MDTNETLSPATIARMRDFVAKQHPEFLKAFDEAQAAVSETAPTAPHFTLDDPDLDDLLNLSASLVEGRANMDVGLAWQDALNRVLARLAPAGSSSMQTYPLPESLYPGSKDWASSNYAGRVEWLHTMYEARKRDVEDYESRPVAPPAAAVWGWAVVDKNGDEVVTRARLTSYMGIANVARPPISAEAAADYDREQPRNAPHRVLTLYAPTSP